MKFLILFICQISFFILMTLSTYLLQSNRLIKITVLVLLFCSITYIIYKNIEQYLYKALFFNFWSLILIFIATKNISYYLGILPWYREIPILPDIIITSVFVSIYLLIIFIVYKIIDFYQRTHKNNRACKKKMGKSIS